MRELFDWLTLSGFAYEAFGVALLTLVYGACVLLCLAETGETGSETDES